MYRKLYFLTAMLLSMTLQAQQTATVGTGTTSSSSEGPIYRSAASSSFDFCRYHYVFTQAELSAAGLTAGVALTDIAWYKANTSSTNGPAEFEIWVKNSNRTSVQSPPQQFSTLTTGATQVFSSNNVTFNSSSGWKNFDFNSPFIYTGGALEVTVAWDISMVSGSPTTGSFTWRRHSISNRVIYMASSSNSTSLSSTRSTRAHTRFTYNSCLAPASISAGNITTNSADLNWPSVNNVIGYEYAVTPTATPPATGTNTTATNTSVSGLSLNTTYYMHVRSKCSPTSFSLWTTSTFITNDAYCKGPTQVLFNNITPTSADAIWSMMATSDYYQYYLDVTPNGLPVGSKSISTPGITASFTNLSPSTKYYIFIRSICLNGTDSSTWTVDSFVTQMVCGAPNVRVDNMESPAPTAWWNVVPTAVSYEYALTNTAAEPAFGNEVYDTTLSLQLSSEDNYLHVRTKCNSIFTFSKWTTTQLESGVGITGIDGSKPVSVYPNPISKRLFVENAVGYKYSIIDLSGRVLQRGAVTRNNFVIEMRSQAQGMYFLYLSDGAEQIRFKLLKQ